MANGRAPARPQPVLVDARTLEPTHRRSVPLEPLSREELNAIAAAVTRLSVHEIVRKGLLLRD